MTKPNELREILDRFEERLASRPSYQPQWTEEAEAAIFKWVDEVIGADEHNWIEATPSQRTVSEALNHLRAEQRRRAGL